MFVPRCLGGHDAQQLIFFLMNVMLCVRYVHLSRCATYAIGCVYAAMAQREMGTYDLVRELQLRVRCQGVTCKCISEIACAPTLLWRDVRMRLRC